MKRIEEAEKVPAKLVIPAVPLVDPANVDTTHVDAPDETPGFVLASRAYHTHKRKGKEAEKRSGRA